MLTFSSLRGAPVAFLCWRNLKPQSCEVATAGNLIWVRLPRLNYLACLTLNQTKFLCACLLLIAQARVIQPQAEFPRSPLPSEWPWFAANHVWKKRGSAEPHERKTLSKWLGFFGHRSQKSRILNSLKERVGLNGVIKAVTIGYWRHMGGHRSRKCRCQGDRVASIEKTAWNLHFTEPKSLFGDSDEGERWFH